MKCRKCDAKAAINMRQHKLALCQEHYLEWVPEQTQRFIETYEMFRPRTGASSGCREARIALRCGTCSCVWATGRMVLYIGLGIDYADGGSYSGESLPSARFCESFWPNAHLEVADVKALYGGDYSSANRGSVSEATQAMLCVWLGQTAHHESSGPRWWLCGSGNRSQSGTMKRQY